MTHYSNFGARYLKPAVPPAIAAYVQLARDHDVSPAQMALAWVSSRWYVASNIIGATTMAQLKENIASLDVLITPELDAAIEAIHKQNPSPAN
jgi:aryl-alcohol dehydrogenase-like predicted oxidoreductase